MPSIEYIGASRTKLAQTNGKVTTHEDEQTLTGLNLVNPDAPKEHCYDWPDETLRKIIGIILSEPDFLALGRKLIKPVYFREHVHRAIVKSAFRLYDDFGIIPDKDTVSEAVRRCVVTEADNTLYSEELKSCYESYQPGMLSPRQKWIEDITGFAGIQAVRVAINEGLDELSAKKPLNDRLDCFYSLLDDARQVTQKKDDSRAYSLQELYQLPEVRWQVGRHFPQGCLGCIYGGFGTGKSFYALDLALSVASGKPFLGIYEVMQGPVAYIAPEGFQGIRKRVDAWCQHYKKELPKDFVLLTEAFDFVQPSTPKRVADKIIKKLGKAPTMIFGDTLARLFGNGDENGTRDMSTFVNHFTKLGQLCDGASTIVIHHVGKEESKGARGSVALAAACDSMIYISGSPDSAVTVSNSKQKDGPEFTDYSLKAKHYDLTFDPKDGEGSLAFELLNQWTAKFRTLNEGQRKLFSALYPLGSFSFTEGEGAAFEWTDGLKVHMKPSTYKGRLSQLVKHGFVEKMEDGSYIVAEGAGAVFDGVSY